MKSWFSKVFSSEKDPFISYLMRDKTIFDDIRMCLSNNDTLPKSKELQTHVIHTAERFTHIASGYDIVKISRESEETDILQDFINPLIITFSLLPTNSTSSISIVHALSILYSFLDVSKDIPRIPEFLFNLCGILSIYPFISDIIDIITSYVISNKSYIDCLRNPSFFIKFHSNFLLNSQYSGAIQLLANKLLDNFSNYHFDSVIDFNEPTKLFYECLKEDKIPPENLENACILFAVFLNITNQLILLENREILQIFHDKLLEKQSKSLPNVFYLFSINTKGQICKPTFLFMYDHIIRVPISSNSMFSMFKTFEYLLRNLNNDITSLEKAYPINTIFKPPQKYVNSEVAEEILTIFQLLISNNFDRLVFCLKPIFNILTNFELDINYTIYQSLNSLVEANKITPSDLNDNSFLQIIMSKKERIFSNLKDPSFISLLEQCYATINDDDVQWNLMKILLQTEKIFEQQTKFSQFCSKFLTISPSYSMVLHLMAFIIDSPKESFMNIFISSFTDSIEICDIFVKNDGLQWLSNLMLTINFQPYLIGCFISSLMHFKIYQEVNETIKELPLNHPIFSLDSDLLYNIVFTSSVANQTNIRVPALLPLIKIKNPINLSPYSVYATSKSSLSEFVRHGVKLDDNQIVIDMANRYITSSQFLYLLKNTKKCSNYCKLNTDNFPLFEVTNSTQRNSFLSLPNIRFKFLSIWLKFVDENSLSFVVLKTNLFNVFWKENFLVFERGKNSKKVKIECGKWTLVSIVMNQELEICIGSEIIKFKVNDEDFTNLTIGSFDTLCPCKWFIGSAIRISNSMLNISDILQFGPGNYSQISDEFLITPYSNYKNMNRGDGFLSIPYCGFPWYFSIYQNEVYNEMMSTQNSERIEDLIRCFLFAKILVPNLKNIWITIISILKEKHELLSESFRIELFSILFTSTKKPYFMNFLYDVDIWYLYGKYLLKTINGNLNTLINRFKIKKTVLASILSSVYKIIPDKVLIVKYLLKFGRKTGSSVFLSHAFNLFASADLEKRDIIKTINNFLTKNNKLALIADIFTFDEIVDVMSNLTKSDIIIDLLKMITILSTMKNGYIKNPSKLSLSLIPHLMYHDVWILLFQIATGRKPLDDKSDTPIISFSDKFLVNEQILPLIVSLIGFSFISLTIIYTDENRDKNEVKKLEEDLKDSIAVISNFGRYNNQLFLSHELFDFVLFFTPLFYDPTALFSDELSILSQLDKITISEPNMKYVFNSWSFTQDFYQIWMKNKAISPPIFTFTFIAFFAPLVTFYAPSFKFPLAENEKFPEFLISKVSEVTNFFILFLASSLNDFDKFKKLFDTIVFTSPYKKLDGYSKFAVTLIVNFLTKRDIYSSPLESLEYLFKSIALELKERTFGDDNKLIITSCLTSLNALSNAMPKADFMKLTFATRQILALTFDVCKITEISEITNLLAATSIFLYNFRVFDDFTFSGGFLIKMTNSLQDGDRISSKFLDEFAEKIILSDNFLKQFQLKFGEDEFHNLMRFINGVKVLMNRGKNGYFNWISSNQEVYISMTEKLENLNKIFLDEIENDQNIIFNKSEISEKIIEMSLNLHNQTNKNQSKKFYLANSIEFLQNSFLNIMLRITETNMSKEYIKHHKLFGQSTEYFKPKSFRLSQTKLPVLNSRVMSPSNYELPHVEFTDQNDESTDETNENNKNNNDEKTNQNENKNEDLNIKIENNDDNYEQKITDNEDSSNEKNKEHVENDEKHYIDDVQNKSQMSVETKEEEIHQNPIGINDLVDCFQRNLMKMFSFVQNKKFLPLTYSGLTIDDNFLNYINFSFVTTEDKENFISKFNAKLLFYTFSIDSAVFQLKSKILILLNANLAQNNELILEKSSKNDSLFEKLSQSIFDLSFGNFTLFAGHFLLEIPFSSIIYSQKHLINHKQNGILFSTLQTGDIILHTNDNGFPSQFLNIFNIENDGYLLHNLQLSEATNLWSNGSLSNFEYLSLLNSFSGRSFVDLAQYPVFPWIIADYESKIYPQKKRNLEKVMGQLSEERAKFFDVSFQTQGYYYGCHYSMPASVHYFLFRIPPFLFFEWDLHGGWDNKDRMFFDIERSWISSSVENTNDVKELLPEFYSIPDFLTDKSEIKIEKVTLPPYSINPVHFIMIQREELEKAKIENWIDLIFGFKQTGTAAIQAQNVFMPTLYHNYVMKEDDDMETISLQLENWGQCPIQLFKKKHQPKNSLIENISDNFDVFENNFVYSNLICYIDKGQFYRVDTGNMSIVNESSLIITDKLLCFATKIDVSSNECFCVVDFSNGLSRVYRLQSGFGSEKFPLFPHESNGFSKINGQDLFVGTTDNEKNLILWDFVRGRILRVLEFDEKIVDFCFDEYEGLVFVLFNSKLTVLTVNGMHYTTDESIRNGKCISMMRIPNYDRNRYFFVGFSNGHVKQMKIDLSPLKIEIIKDFCIGKVNLSSMASITNGITVADNHGVSFDVMKIGGKLNE